MAESQTAGDIAILEREYHKEVATACCAVNRANTLRDELLKLGIDPDKPSRTQ